MQIAHGVLLEARIIGGFRHGAFGLQRGGEIMDRHDGGAHRSTWQDAGANANRGHFFRREAGGNAGHVVEDRAFHRLADMRHLFLVLWAFHESEVRARFQKRIGAGDGFFHGTAMRAARIGARDDHEIRIQRIARFAGGADFQHRFITRNHFPPRDMAAALGRHLVFQMQPRHTGTDIFFHRADNIDGIAKTRIGIGNQRRAHGRGNQLRIQRHFGQRNQPRIRQAKQIERCAIARHVKCRKTRMFQNAGRHGVEAAGQDQRRGFAQKRAQACGGAGGAGLTKAHRCFPYFSGKPRERSAAFSPSLPRSAPMVPMREITRCDQLSAAIS